MMTTMTMVTVHEYVHQWARQQDEPRQEWKNVRSMFGDEEECSNDREHGECQFSPGTPSIAIVLNSVGHGRSSYQAFPTSSTMVEAILRCIADPLHLRNEERMPYISTPFHGTQQKDVIYCGNGSGEGTNRRGNSNSATLPTTAYKRQLYARQASIAAHGIAHRCTANRGPP